MGEERWWDQATRSWKTRGTKSDSELADAKAKEQFQDTSTLIKAAEDNKAKSATSTPVEDSPLVAASKKAAKARKAAQISALSQ